ncbi:hypothetical protein N8463_02775, partial [Synechococcus sp. AH-601-P06]|nr:hypothetical protein [Synechococcus sp. AH-601-P06]
AYEPKLEPYKTQVVIEAFLQDYKFLTKPNYEGDYRVTFIPATASDFHRLAEKGEEALKTLMMSMKAWEPEPQRNYELKTGVFFAQQPEGSFVPQLKVAPEQLDLVTEPVSLKLHFHDDYKGKVFLSCDYVDAYLPSIEERMEEHQARMNEGSAPADDIDW